MSQHAKPSSSAKKTPVQPQGANLLAHQPTPQEPQPARSAGHTSMAEASTSCWEDFPPSSSGDSSSIDVAEPTRRTLGPSCSTSSQSSDNRRSPLATLASVASSVLAREFPDHPVDRNPDQMGFSIPQRPNSHQKSRLTATLAHRGPEQNECSHYHNYMAEHSSDTIVDTVGDNTLLSVLYKTKLICNDILRPKSGDHRYAEPTVYSGFRPHWYPVYNCYELTLAAACNTTIGAPVMVRTGTKHVQLTFMATTDSAQTVVRYYLPLDVSDDEANNTFILRSSKHSNLATQCLQYAVVAANAIHIPLILITVWNLSAYECNLLHRFSLLLPAMPHETSEIHILGLHGTRNTAFAREQLPLIDVTCQLLSAKDLSIVGYNFNSPGRSLYSLEECRHDTTLALLERQTNTSCGFQRPGKIYQPLSYCYTDSAFENPQYYPPLHEHTYDEKQLRYLLKDAYAKKEPWRRLTKLKRPFTLKEAKKQCRQMFPKVCPTKQLYKLFNFPDGALRDVSDGLDFAEVLYSFEQQVPTTPGGNIVLKHRWDKELRFEIPHDWIATEWHTAFQRLAWSKPQMFLNETPDDSVRGSAEDRSP